MKSPQIKILAEKFNIPRKTINHYINVLTPFQAKSIISDLIEKVQLLKRTNEDKLASFYNLRLKFLETYYMIEKSEIDTKKEKGSITIDRESLLLMNENYAK